MLRIKGLEHWFCVIAVAVLTLASFPRPAVAQLTGPTPPDYPGTPGYPGGGYDQPYDGGCYGGDCAAREIEASSPEIGRILTTSGGRYEFIVIGPASEAEAVRAIIESVGGSVVRTNNLGALGQTSQIATFPSQAARDRAHAEIARLAPNSSLSGHHIYGFAQSLRSPRLYAPALIGDAGLGRCHLSRPVRIGMIDGPVNMDHPSLVGASISVETVISSNRMPSANHGTAVAALIVGQDESGVLAGFAQGAQLHAVSAFALRDTGEEAGVEQIAAAIDLLVARRVDVINLSIAGPPNSALGRAVTAAAARGVVMVAASGNNQRPSVAWPAAASEVIAVTAIDAARRRFRRANTGVELEFAAPGVDVYTARARGAGYMTGTSFAAPIVTALAARHIAQGASTTDAVRARLRNDVETLGPGRRNTEFGWGLVQSGGC